MLLLLGNDWLLHYYHETRCNLEILNCAKLYVLYKLYVLCEQCVLNDLYTFYELYVLCERCVLNDLYILNELYSMYFIIPYTDLYFFTLYGMYVYFCILDTKVKRYERMPKQNKTSSYRTCVLSENFLFDV